MTLEQKRGLTTDKRRLAHFVPEYEDNTLGTDYILRYCALFRAGRFPIVLVSQSNYWIAKDPMDPWGSKEPVSHETLRRMIDKAEIEAI